jgi:membrane associated rhomboid family serine protease
MSQRAIDYIKNDATVALIAVNVVVFIALKIGKLIAMSAVDNNMQWLAQFALSSDIDELWQRPWCLLTYMFTQTDTLHLLFNALWLFCFGRIISTVISYRNVIALYIIGGIVGGLLFVCLYHTTGGEGWLMGASASVIAIAMAVAVVMPKHRIAILLIGEVKAIWFVLAVVVIISLGTVGNNLGGAIAHAGGIITGLIYGAIIKRNYDRASSIEDIELELKALLKKVNQNGFYSLSSHERKRLFELSAKRNSK